MKGIWELEEGWAKGWSLSGILQDAFILGCFLSGAAS